MSRAFTIPRVLLLAGLFVGLGLPVAVAGPLAKGKGSAKAAPSPAAKIRTRLEGLNPGAKIRTTNLSAKELELASKPRPQPQLTLVPKAKTVSKAALAAEFHVPEGSLGGPQVIGFGRAKFTTPSGMGVFMEVMRPDSVYRGDDGMGAFWWHGGMPTSWVNYYKPYGLRIALSDIPVNRQVVLKCEVTTFHGSTIHLREFPTGSTYDGVSVDMTLGTVSSSAHWGETTASLSYVTTASPEKSDTQIYIAAHEFAFRDRNCTIAELDA